MFKMTPGRTSLWIALIATAGSLTVGTFALGHGQKHNPTRHHYMMQNGVPAAYQDLLNPLKSTMENLTQGKSLYTDNCAACHGNDGSSLTEAAKDLDPPPATLSGMYDRTMTGMGTVDSGGHIMHGMMHHHPGMTHAEAMGGLNLDAYSYWAVSDGGAAFGSGMPAFKDILKEKERWQVLLYVANDFSDKPSS